VADFLSVAMQMHVYLCFLVCLTFSTEIINILFNFLKTLYMGSW